MFSSTLECVLNEYLIEFHRIICLQVNRFVDVLSLKELHLVMFRDKKWPIDPKKETKCMKISDWKRQTSRINGPKFDVTSLELDRLLNRISSNFLEWSLDTNDPMSFDKHLALSMDNIVYKSNDRNRVQKDRLANLNVEQIRNKESMKKEIKLISKRFLIIVDKLDKNTMLKLVLTMELVLLLRFESMFSC